MSLAVITNFESSKSWSAIKKALQYCVPPNFMANRRVPNFSLNNCAQSPKKTFMCPTFHTDPVLKYTKCHISTNLSSFLKLCLLYCQKLFALVPTNRRFAEKNWLSGSTASVHGKKQCAFLSAIKTKYKTKNRISIKVYINLDCILMI